MAATAGLCREEKIKQERNPLDLRADLETFEKAGAGTVSKDDTFRFKWHGLFHGAPKSDAFMLRIKTEGGRLQAGQLAAVADLAESLCEPRAISLTTRQGIQVRGVSPAKAAQALREIEAVGLTSASSGADNIRNVTGCPVDGLLEKEILDTRALLAELRSTFLARPDFKNLPRKFNVSLSGCGSYCTHPEIHDLGFVAVQGNGHGTGFCLNVGGNLGRNPFMARDFGFFIPSERVIEVACAIVEVFSANGCRANRGKARMAHLVEDWGIERFRKEVIGHLDAPLDAFEMPVLAHGDTEHDHLGTVAQKESGKFIVGVPVPGGNLSVLQARGLARIAGNLGSGELRLTHHQNVLIPDLPAVALAQLPSLLEGLGLTMGPSPFLAGVAACTGIQGCKFGVVETKKRAVDLARGLETRFPSIEPLLLHLSACQNGCGHHQVADIGLLGKQRTIDGVKQEVFDIQVGGGTGPQPTLARTVMENVPGSSLEGVLAFVVASYLQRRRAGESFQQFCRRLTQSQLELFFTPWNADARDGLLDRFARWQLSRSALHAGGAR